MLHIDTVPFTLFRPLFSEIIRLPFVLLCVRGVVVNAKTLGQDDKSPYPLNK